MTPLVEGTAPGSPLALLVLVVLVLAAFVAAGGLVELLGRWDDRAQDRADMAAGREALRHANEIGDDDA